VFDIARMLRDHGPALDLAKMATYLSRKCQSRGIPVSRTAFADQHVKAQAAYQYDLEVRVGPSDRIPFEDAWASVLTLVGQLAIPEQSQPLTS
jgi:hypothetical protein